MSEITPQLPGRLGNPDITLRDDPRADPRMLAAMDALGLLEPQPPAPVNASSSLEELLAFCVAAEEGYEQLNQIVTRDWPPLTGVTQETRTIKGVDDNDVTLYIHRPNNTSGPLPAHPSYSWWRHGLDVCRRAYL